MDNEKKYAISFCTYKPRRSGDGIASQFDLNVEKNAVFLEMANQGDKDKNGNASFDWKNKIAFKLGTSDIGEILSVLCGMQSGVGQLDKETNNRRGLYHENKEGNAVLYFSRAKQGGFWIGLSVKRGSDHRKLKHFFTNAEVCILETLLKRAVELIYHWV